MSDHSFGWRRSRPDARDFHFSAHPDIARSLPAKVDLEPGMPPVRDQEPLGSCTSFAGDGAFQFDRTKQGLPQIETSPLFTYYCERDMEGTTGYDAGAEMRSILKSYQKYGSCPESLWPYDISKYREKPPANCYSEALKNQALVYSAVLQNLCLMQGVLASGLPFLVGFSVYDSFESNEVATTGIVPMPDLNRESVLGGHAVVAVGYDNSTRTFKMRNSWGMSWGDRGYFYFPYEYLTNSDLSSDFWVLQTVETGE